MFRKLTIALMTFLLAGTNVSFAARIFETGNRLTTVKNCSLQIEGQIAAGDAALVEENLQRVLESTQIRSNPPDAEHIDTFIVCLSGPGGSYLEGIKLAELFVKYGVATVVPDNMTCKSACAIAFLGGKTCCDDSGKPVLQRFLFPGSRLGFHAPSLNLSGAGEYSRESALKAYDLGLEAVARLRENAELFSVNDVFMSKIFDHRGQDFYYIKTLDDAEFNDLLLTGYRARKLKRDTNQAACWNAWNWHVAGHGGVLFNLGDRSYSSISAEHWKSVFQESSSFSGKFVGNSEIYVFFPFDGSVNCLVREARRDGRRMLDVVISEGDVSRDPDPRVRGFFRPTLLMRGNRTLQSTR